MIEKLRSFMRSIRFRLALWFVAILAVVMAAFSLFIYARQANDLRTETVDRLNYRTHKWEAFLSYGGREYFENQRPLPVYNEENSEQLLQENDIVALIDTDGQVLQKAGPITEDELQALVSTGIENRVDSHPFTYPVVAGTTGATSHREQYFFVVAAVALDHRVIGFFILGSPVDPTGQLPRLLFTLVLGNLLTLGLALAGGYWLADRAMRPVQTITRTAREIGETDLNRRLNLSTQDELGALASTFDGMLARLQAAFDRQRQFTADAGHELRTPLTIVSLETSRALASRRSPAEYERVLRIIQSENDFMTRLVNNLLTLSRMDAGQAGLKFEALDLSDLALEVAERLEPLAERRGASLSTGELPELKVWGDRQYLGQLIANLVENAIKYSDGAAPRVRVETGADPERQAVWVMVEDNGPGISSEHLEKIFDRFYQVDQARSHNEDEASALEGQVLTGSGLGLSIVQRIAHAHAGEVQVRSETGRGSTFIVRLPMLDPNRNADD